MATLRVRIARLEEKHFFEGRSEENVEFFCVHGYLEQAKGRSHGNP
jgi:hypothetical protein